MTDQSAEQVIYVCRVCGYDPGSHASWCNCGCGSDYNEMVRVRLNGSVVLTEEEAEWAHWCAVVALDRTTEASRSEVQALRAKLSRQEAE